MKYDRIFAFGCSYTRFPWPTWADIIAYDLDIPFENWANAGHGNVSIAHHMLECNLLKKFTTKDLILVCWSTWNREDRLMQDGWHAGGNILNNNFYGRKWLKKYWSEYNDTAKNCYAIISANKMHNISHQSHIADYANTPLDQGPALSYSFNTPGYMEYGLDVLEKELPQKILFDNFNNSKFEGQLTDLHPDIKSHLNHAYLVLDMLGINMKETTKKGYTKLHNDVVNSLRMKYGGTRLSDWARIKEFMVSYNWGHFMKSRDINRKVGEAQ